MIWILSSDWRISVILVSDWLIIADSTRSVESTGLCLEMRTTERDHLVSTQLWSQGSWEEEPSLSSHSPGENPLC